MLEIIEDADLSIARFERPSEAAGGGWLASYSTHERLIGSTHTPHDPVVTPQVKQMEVGRVVCELGLIGEAERACQSGTVGIPLCKTSFLDCREVCEEG